ncbi:MAG: PKD domain-containing protein [Solirubrobacteraceae bacterium]|nr:PKD domain-containing protein [Solirubrobacteraceae bacterium]
MTARARRPRARTLATPVGVVALALCGAGPASAAWTPSTSALPLDADTPPVVLIGPVPGSAAVVATEVGALATAIHRPGESGWVRGTTIPAGPDDQVIVGDGGLAALGVLDGGGQVVHVQRAGPDGALTDLGSFPIGVEEAVTDLAVAPDGSAVVVVMTATNGLAVWHRDAAGAWTAHPAATVEVSDASAAVGPTGTLTVAWSENDVDGYAVRAHAATFGSGATPFPHVAVVGDTSAGDATVVEIAAIPSRDGRPGAAWLEDGGDGRERIVGGPEGAIVELWTGPEGTIEPGIAATSSVDRTLVRALDADGLAALVMDPDRGCVAQSDVEDGVVVDRSGALVVVGARAGRLVAAPVDDACVAGADPHVGPTTPPGSAIAAATDVDGTLVVAIDPPDASQPTLVAVEDRTPPTITGIDAPEAVTTGQTFSVSGDAYDAWGVTRLRWRFGDADVGAGGTARGRFGIAGRRTVTLQATDPSGNVGRLDRTVTVTAAPSAVEPPETDRPPASTTPTGPPVTVPLPPRGDGDAEAAERPRIRALRIRRRAGRWTVTVQARHVERLVVSLYRERYVKGTDGVRRRARPPVCPRRDAPDRRPATGRRGRIVVQVDGRRTTLRLPRSMERALRRRGRYKLRVVAHGAEGTRRAAARRHITVCR